LKISTIIPVYNAEKFIKKAVESASQFDDVIEIILVEDGSTDNSLKICKEIDQSNDKVKLFCHQKGKNKGAGASRNLGIQQSTGEYLSFLDADDYYLPNRFDAERVILRENPNADAVYGALGVLYYSEASKKKFSEVFSDNQFNENYLTTIASLIKPEDLFESLIGLKKNEGYFHLDCLTVKASALKKMNYCFNEKLKLHQDTELMIRLSYHLKLFPGSIQKEIAKRGIHSGNRITQIATHSRNYYLNKYKLYNSLYVWSKKEAIGKHISLYFKAQKNSYQCKMIFPFSDNIKKRFKKSLLKKILHKALK
jgi:glycosyltransferase involved in cell wall biosynthesis